MKCLLDTRIVIYVTYSILRNYYIVMSEILPTQLLNAGKIGDVINCSGGHIFIKCSSDEDTHAYIRELKGKFIAEYIVSNSIAYGVSLRCDTITLPVMIMKVVNVGPLHRYDSVVFDVIIVDKNNEITETTYTVCF